jgi:hypothetical protein
MVGGFGAPGSCAVAIGSRAASAQRAASAHARRATPRGSFRILTLHFILTLRFGKQPEFPVAGSDRTATGKKSLAL